MVGPSLDVSRTGWQAVWVGCPDDDTLALLLGGELDDDGPLHAHLERCPRCSAVVDELAVLYHGDSDGDGDGDGDEPDDAPARGDSIAGRYRIERTLGRGGMGVVVLAHDEQLHRPVAVKLVRPEAAAEHGEQLQARLHREAQAMARISDPAVVPVLDVGRDGSLVYVVMELVDGITLRAWLAERRHPPERILEVVLAAGRGLSAAHRAGLVHRDFKPDNVLIGHDGRVRVTDFGMARLSGRRPGASSSQQSMGISGSVSGDVTTQAGTVMGTPAYMSPEQIDGRTVDARSDQYAWCVVLVEALTGTRPCGHPSTRTRRHQAQRGGPTSALDGLPAPVRAVVRRGLAKDPAARWRTLDEAMRGLSRPSRRRRWGSVVVLAMIPAGWWLIPGPSTSSKGAMPRCEEGAAAVASVWAEARARVDEGPDEPDPHVRAALEHYVEALASSYRNHRCDAIPTSTTRADVLDCLDRRRARLGSLLERWASDPSKDLFDAVQSQGTPDGCFEAGEVRPLPLDPAQAQRVRRLREELEVVWSEFALGNFDQVGVLLDALHDEIDATGFEPLRAEWGLVYGRLLDRQADYPQALTRLQEAFWGAHRGGDELTAARSATAIFQLLGDTLGRYDEAERWARHAESALERADRPHAWFRYHQAQVIVAIRRVEPGRAREHAEQALAMAERLWPPGYPNVISARANLAVVDSLRGDLAAAESSLVRALADHEHDRGASHPDLVPILHSLAEVVSRQGRSHEADAFLVRSLQIIEKVHGLDHPLASDARNGQAIVAAMRQDYDRAEALFVEDLAYIEQRLGPDDERAIRLRANLAHLRVQQGKLALAREDLEVVLAWEEDHNGASALGLVPRLLMLVDIELGEGRAVEAQAHVDRAGSILEEHEDFDPDLRSSVLQRRGALLRQRGEWDAARVELDRSLSLRREDTSRAPVLIELGHLERDRGDRVAAEERYREALAVAEPQTVGAHDARAALDALLASSEPVRAEPSSTVYRR